MDILIADTDPARALALNARLIREFPGVRVRIAPSETSLAELTRDTAPDVIIVDLARPDRDGLDQIRGLAAGPAPVMLFIDEDDPGFMEQAISAGVISYHVDAAAIRDIKPILRSAIALYRHLHARETRLHQAEAALLDRRAIDAAKRRLIERERMSEPAAHRFLQRRAMDQQLKLADVARALLRDPADPDGTA